MFVGKENIRMKKLFFTLVASLLFAANSFAQNAFAAFAVLEHDGALTTFTGGEALRQAVDAAEDGDVITLSAGQFSVGYSNLEIKKSITLRGAGIDVNDGKNYTAIGGTTYGLTLDFRNNSDMSITLEGIDLQYGVDSSYDSEKPGNSQLNINKCIVIKCYAYTKNVTINSSKIMELRVLDGSSVKCNNSVIDDSQTPYGTTYTNCIVNGGNGNYGTYENCILSQSYGYFLSSCIANHCVYVNNVSGYTYTPSSFNSDITIVENWSDVFNFEGTNDDFKIYDQDFLRKQNFESKVVTVPQVGIYGGLMPWSPVLALPSIKNITVAKQSDGEGKLSIDVEIED